MIWIIGGTSEAGELAERLKGRTEFVVTVATEFGKKFAKAEDVVSGRMDLPKMRNFIRSKGIDKVVDMSHPYAQIVSSNAKEASLKEGALYIRYLRESSIKDDDCESGIICTESVESCAELLKSIKGTVFFTTGAKNIPDFQKVRGDNRFVYRVLPSEESLRICTENDVQMKDIVAMLGPFSEELNIELFRFYNADYAVLKDSGERGGTSEKLKACKASGAVPVLIGRKCETGIKDMDKLLEMIL